MIGTAVQPRRPRIDLDAVDAGQPEVEDDDVGMVRGRERRAPSSPRRRDVDVVAARPEVDPERAQDLRLVVDDEDARSRAASQAERPSSARRPGVSSTSSSPPIASTNPRATARPSPTPVAVRAVAEPLERHEHALALGSRGMPGPRSMTRSVDPAVDRAGLDPHRLAGRRVRERVGDDVGDRALEQARVGLDARQGLGHVDVDGSRAGAELRERGRATTSSRPTGVQRRRRARRSGAGSCRAGCRRAVEPVGLLVDRLEELAVVVSASSRRRCCSRLVTDALIEASGVRRSCETAAAAPCAARWPPRALRPPRPRPASRGSSATASWRANASRTRWSSAATGAARRATSRCASSELDIDVAPSSGAVGDGVAAAASTVHAVVRHGAAPRRRRARRSSQRRAIERARVARRQRRRRPAARAPPPPRVRARRSAARRAASVTSALTIAATTRNTTSASRFSPSAIVNV